MAAIVLAAAGCASGATMRGVLLSPGDDLHGWRERGFNAAIVRIDLDGTAKVLEPLRREAAKADLDLYLWIDVGRSPALAAAHPGWIAGMGSHEDWRARFPDAPRPGPGQRVGVFPWTPIAYREVHEDRRAAIGRLLRGRIDGIAGVFLHHIQAAPSACGCGNDQCRWTVDYRMPGGPPRVDGSPAARLVASLRKDHPGVLWIPVWVTECEEDDQGEGSTGLCGSVHCYSGLCWKESARELEPLLEEIEGPLAVLLATKAFRRGIPRYEARGGWEARALRLLEEVPPLHGRRPVAAGRLIAVVEPRGVGPEGAREAAEKAIAAGAGGAVAVLAPLDEGWEPRLIPSVSGPERPRASGEGHPGH